MNHTNDALPVRVLDTSIPAADPRTLPMSFWVYPPLDFNQHYNYFPTLTPATAPIWWTYPSAPPMPMMPSAPFSVGSSAQSTTETEHEPDTLRQRAIQAYRHKLLQQQTAGITRLRHPRHDEDNFQLDDSPAPPDVKRRRVVSASQPSTPASTCPISPTTQRAPSPHSRNSCTDDSSSSSSATTPAAITSAIPTESDAEVHSTSLQNTVVCANTKL
jgi:hypothetical protein